MTLEARARAVARYRAGTSNARAAAAIIGAVGAVGGSASGVMPLAVGGGVLMGLSLGAILAGIDRAYLEGFADGLVWQSNLGTEPGVTGSDGQPRGSEDLAGLPRRLSEDRGATERHHHSEPDRSGSGSSDRSAESPLHGGGAAILAGIDIPDRRSSGPVFDDDGRPILTRGPRSASFPIPPAEPARSSVVFDASRAAPRRQNRHRERQESEVGSS